jgi:molecular chaperone GrpE
MADNDDDKNATESPGAAPPPAPAEPSIQQLTDEKKELHDRLLRTAADFENYKKRMKREADEAQNRGRDALARELLPALDNLERALKHAAPDDPMAVGVGMVQKQLMGALEKLGITRFSSLGQPFDPNVHDAIQQVETDAVPPNTVAEEFAGGYMAGGRLLRPAMVAVAKAPARQPSSDTSGDSAAPGEGGG